VLMYCWKLIILLAAPWNTADETPCYVFNGSWLGHSCVCRCHCTPPLCGLRDLCCGVRHAAMAGLPRLARSVGTWLSQFLLYFESDLHTLRVTGFIFSSVHRAYVSASADGTIKWWSIQGRHLTTVVAHRRGICAMLQHPGPFAMISSLHSCL
jgi:hypothetical protein